MMSGVTNTTMSDYNAEYGAPYLNTDILRLLGRDGFIMMIVFIFLISLLLSLTIYLICVYCCCGQKHKNISKDGNPRFGTVVSPGISYSTKKPQVDPKLPLYASDESTLQVSRTVYHDGVNSSVVLNEEQMIDVQMSDMNLMDEIAASTHSFKGEASQSATGVSRRQTLDIEGQQDMSLSSDQSESRSPAPAPLPASTDYGYGEHVDEDGSMVI